MIAMNFLMSAALVVSLIGEARVASAAGSLPLPAPPPPGAPVSSTLRDAMLAVERAAATNPAAAQRAAFFYDAAIEQYNAHQYDRARASAITAIGQSAVAPLPATPALHAPIAAAPFPGPRYNIIPEELPATPANAQRYVALAHRALTTCPGVKVATAEYRGAVSALSAKRYSEAMAKSKNSVDDCTGR